MNEVKQFGKVFVATDGDITIVGATEELALQALEEAQAKNTKVEEAQQAKVPAPIESPKGLGWFDGTSWGTK